ncbi:MAG: helix-turn-helix domain-containing protein [Actinobacteria bacterium]|nr:helix-turn-helix domain-containing protein [Actinomycetota bacterium]
MAVLLREAIGDRLRRTRTSQHRTLREVSREARVSLGYLSEVERGRKEASSELLASICGALELPLDELLFRVAGDVGPGTAAQVPDTVPDELVDATIRAADPEGGRHVVAAPGGRLAELQRSPASDSAPGGPRAMAGVAA